MTPEPPSLPRRLLGHIVRRDPAGPAILGDLREDFTARCRRDGIRAARRWYAREALTLAFTHAVHLTLGSRGDPSMRRSTTFAGLREDLGYALGTLRRSPAFTLTSALVVGLGVGATTAAFSIMRPLLSGALPFAEADRLVWIENAPGAGASNSLSSITSRTGNVSDFRERVNSFEGLAAYNAFSRQTVYTLQGEGAPEQLRAYEVTTNFLDVLGVEPRAGRNFTEAEGAWGGPDAAILTHGYWVRRFSADPAVVGRSLNLNGAPYEVVGVLPPDFDFASVFEPGEAVDFLTPWPISPETDSWGNTSLMVARLRPGASLQQAQAELARTVTALEQEQPDRWGLGARAVGLREHLAAPFRQGFLLLGGASLAVLLIVSVNVSNMLLARSPGRSREMAVRKAMGASRVRVVRQFLWESLAIGVLGGVVGLAVAVAAVRFFTTAPGIQLPLLEMVRLDRAALAVGIGLSLLTGLLVGVYPALRVAEGSEAKILRDGGRGQSGNRGARRLREALVVAELALACVLLIAGSLLVRSFQAVMDVEFGFESTGAVAWQLNPGRDFEDRQEMYAYFSQVADRVRALPGVEAVGLADALPLGTTRTWGFGIVGQVGEPDPGSMAFFPYMIDHGYLEAMEMPVIQGRGFTEFDGPDGRQVALINESGAQRHFPDGDPVGRSISLFGDNEFDIVGVVADVRNVSPETAAGTQIYLPISQMWSFTTLDLVVRSSGAEASLIPAVRQALGEADPGLATEQFWTLESTLEGAVSVRRFIVQVLTAFGLAALLLAALGIYGVLAFSVAERRSEIGIRMALGASSLDVAWSVIGRTVALAGIGIGLGLVVASATGAFLRSLLFGVGPLDLPTFAGMPLILLAVSLLAAALPALRAARTRGIRALQSD